jgi:hypothetical protein
MAKTNLLIAQRLQKKDPSSKMAEMTKQSINGNLSGFSGIFSPSELSPSERELIHTLLIDYAEDREDVTEDFEQLVSITSEVKAINNQAALLHGERIKRAHAIFTRYRDGAFTAWLIAAYGNRQTPYNLWQYYEFCEAMPKLLRSKIETMPRQAIYTLATRQGPLEHKRRIVEEYQGQTKGELLEIIREAFPLDHHDKRGTPPGEALVQALKKIQLQLQKANRTLIKSYKSSLLKYIKDLESYVKTLD